MRLKTEPVTASPPPMLPLGNDNRTKSYVKLLILKINKFSEDYIQWKSFMDSFKSAINSSHELSNIDKFKLTQKLLA